MIESITGFRPVRREPVVRIATPQTPSPTKSPPQQPPAPQPLPQRTSPATEPLADFQFARRSHAEIESAVRQPKLSLDLFEIKGEFEIDEETNRIKLTVLNTKTGKVLQRIPVFELRGVYQVFRDNLSLNGPFAI